GGGEPPQGAERRHRGRRNGRRRRHRTDGLREPRGWRPAHQAFPAQGPRPGSPDPQAHQPSHDQRAGATLMGQKTQPFWLRVGITEAHRSRWYAPKALYGELLIEDQKIREYLAKRLSSSAGRPHAAVADVHIERTREELSIIIRTARPGVVIGPKGAEVDRM